MTADKILTALINIALALTTALMLLMCTPWAAAQPDKARYYAIITVFWLLLLLCLLMRQWRKNRGVTYKSYIGQAGEVKKRLVKPGGKEIKRAAAGLLKPRYAVGGILLALLFAANHLLLFYPDYVAGLLPRLFGYDGAGRVSQTNILLYACVVSVLLLAGAVLAQTHEIRKNNRIYNIQNLIVNAHSRTGLDKLHIQFMDGEKMFMAANKLEYILQAKPIPAIQLPHGQALLQTELTVKLKGNIPITEFYVKKLSLFVADVVIECENYRQKFYPLFAVNHDFALNFYIHCKDVAALSLSEKFAEAGAIRLYYSFVLKNSVGVITELYGTALYEKEPTNAGGLCYQLREAKDNQYYYM